MPGKPEPKRDLTPEELDVFKRTTRLFTAYLEEVRMNSGPGLNGAVEANAILRSGQATAAGMMTLAHVLQEGNGHLGRVVESLNPIMLGEELKETEDGKEQE